MKIESPAILVVGDVVLLSKRLAQKKIAILRPEAQQEGAAGLQRDYGFRPIQAPAIALAEKSLPRDLLERLKAAECVAFTSANGVKLALQNQAILNSLFEKKVAIGPKTEQALAKKGIMSQVPEEYSSKGLEKMLKGKCRSILFLRSTQEAGTCQKGCGKQGFLWMIFLFMRSQPQGDPRLDNLIKRAASVDIFAFTSSSTARNLMERAQTLGLETELREALAMPRWQRSASLLRMSLPG